MRALAIVCAVAQIKGSGDRTTYLFGRQQKFALVVERLRSCAQNMGEWIQTRRRQALRLCFGGHSSANPHDPPSTYHIVTIWHAPCDHGPASRRKAERARHKQRTSRCSLEFLRPPDGRFPVVVGSLPPPHWPWAWRRQCPP